MTELMELILSWIPFVVLRGSSPKLTILVRIVAGIFWDTTELPNFCSVLKKKVHHRIFFLSPFIHFPS